MGPQNTFKDVVNKLNKLSINEKGQTFERICLEFLKISSDFKGKVKEVWMWNDFPYKNGNHDTGIDIVVRDYNNQYWAIQCKCYEENHTIQLSELATFLATASKPLIIDGIPNQFIFKWVFTTANNDVSKNLSGHNINFYNYTNFENSDIDWSKLDIFHEKKLVTKEKKIPKDYQVEAINSVIKGFETQDRGQLIMACGSGKTFTSLKIVEEFISKNKLEQANILYLVPSISLLSQTITEWNAQLDLNKINRDINTYAICSDDSSTERAQSIKNEADINVHMPCPATTNVESLKNYFDISNNGHVRHNFFYSTYQSIDVVIDLQKSKNIIFDLVICDEAHRTIGVRIDSDDKEDTSKFIKVHDNKYVNAKKRLYMTATPKIYSNNAKVQIERAHYDTGYTTYSMDDTKVYGVEFYKLTFGQAISRGILSDYRLIVLRTNEHKLANNYKLQTNNVNGAAKIWALLNGLSKKEGMDIVSGDEDVFKQDPYPSLKSVVYTSRISEAEKVAEVLNKCSDPEYFGKDILTSNGYVIPSAKLIEGRDKAIKKEEKLDWLKDNSDYINEDGNLISKVLTNARCLTEGVDVPSLDVISFFERKTSTIDIIQACGRVMRKSKRITKDGLIDKKYGYIIVPIVVDKDTIDDVELQKNEDYKLLVRVIRALRSHDERLDDELNKMNKYSSLPVNICVINSYIPNNEYRDLLEANSDTSFANKYKISSEDLKQHKAVFNSFILRQFGDRIYWENWSKNIGDVVKKIDKNITNEIRKSNYIKEKFDEFLLGLKDTINPYITKPEAINIIAQHIVVLPILKIIFSDGNMLTNNSVYQLMDNMYKEIKFLQEQTSSLKIFYESVNMQIKDIKDNIEAKQELIRTLFENFFRYVDNKLSDKNGVVYTPIEIVDFMLNSVDDILKKEFNKSISDKGIKILDPFTGTGTFITRLLNKLKNLGSSNEEMRSKYQNDIYCNEIMLMSYYIALINIEYTYNLLTNDEFPFMNCVWTDTFQMNEGRKSSQQSKLNIKNFKEVTKLISKENNQNIEVIIGNPPYFTSQQNLNENNQKITYDYLDKRIKETYANNLKGLSTRTRMYDSYIRAFRWASDRLGDEGVIAFITNGGFLDNNSFAGFRRELNNEFDSIYIYDLLGNFRKYDKSQGQNVFGQNCGTRVCITFLVKKASSLNKENIVNYFRIADALKTSQKLLEIKNFNSIKNIPFTEVKLDSNNDWLDHGSEKFYKHCLLCSNKSPNAIETSLFGKKYSLGISTNNNLWRYNFSKIRCVNQDEHYEKIYNLALEKWKEFSKDKVLGFNDFLNFNKFKNIQWIHEMQRDCFDKKPFIFKKDYRIITTSPFVKKYFNLNNFFISRPAKSTSMFESNDSKNKIINITWKNGDKNFSVLSTNNLIDSGMLPQHTQSFPLYWYNDNNNNMQSSINFNINFDDKIFSINDDTLKEFKNKYRDVDITKEDIFNYVYAVLHNDTYKTLYANNLMKETPRIPYLENFRKHSEIGKQLMDLHIGYEDVEQYKNTKIIISDKLNKQFSELNKNNFRISKIRIDKNNKSRIIFNNNITIENIPLEVYDYKICGKSPIEWVVNEYVYDINNDYQYEIINDPNEYDPEKGGKYVFDLILSLITLSLKTNELIKQLPEYKEI